LFVKYMEDLANPEFREEQEKYFAQLAEEQQKQDVDQKEASQNKNPLDNPMLSSGKDTRRIILPKPEFGFSVPLEPEHTSNNSKEQRVYLNVCSNELISKYETIPDTKTNSAQYRMPLSLGREQKEEDANALVYDVVFHPDTVKASRGDPFMMKSIMEICCEYVETHYNKKLGRSGTVYNVRWENECRGKPLAQTIRVKPTHESVHGDGQKPQEPETVIFPKKNESTTMSESTSTTKTSNSSTTDDKKSAAAASVLRKMQSKPKGDSRNTPAAGDPLNDDLYKTFSSALMGEEHKEPELNSLNIPSTTATKSAKIEELENLPHKTPKHVIVHSGTFQIQNYTMSKVDLARNIPEKLIIKITIPELTSAKTIDLEMTSQNLFLTEPTFNYKLDLSLPFPVDSDEGAAKFLKKTNTLVVTLPVNIPRDQLTPSDAPTWETDANAPVINENDEFEKERQARIKAYQDKIEEERLEKLREKKEHEERLRLEREEQQQKELEERRKFEDERKRKQEEEEALQRLLRDQQLEESKIMSRKDETSSMKAASSVVTDDDEAMLRQIKEQKARIAAQKEKVPNSQSGRSGESYESQYFNIDFENKYISEID